MNKFLKYFLVVILFSLSCYKISLIANAVTYQKITTNESTINQALANKFLACFTAEDRLAYADAISTATSDAMNGLYCRCGKPSVLGTDVLAEKSVQPDFAVAVEGRAELYAKNTLETDLKNLNTDIERDCNGVEVGSQIWKAKECAVRKAERIALMNGIQSYYDNSSLTSNVDCSQVRNEVMGSNEGLSIPSYNPVSRNTNTSAGFTITDSNGKQTFITPTDVFVSDSQSLFDSKEELKTKCLAACKLKGGTTSDCNQMCTISRCGCRDDDNDGELEAMCEPGQFGPECLSIGSCNINMCDDPALLKSLGSGTALNTLVAKYYKTSIIEQPSAQGTDSGIQVSEVSASKKCTTSGCDITLTSTIDNQFQVGYIKWGAGAQSATLINSLMVTQGRIELVAGKPKTIHLDTSQANELQLNDGTRIECLSCSGDMALANRLSTGCEKTSETNPHSECKATYDCGSSTPRYGCWKFNYCGVNECNDYLPDKDGNKLQSADCKAASSGQKWKCESRQNCVSDQNGTYATQSECLSSIQCGGGGTATERNTYYCCDPDGTCSQCTEGSPRYVNPTQCASDCSKLECESGTFKCGTTCCDSLNDTCSNYKCTKAWTCSGTCCANGCKIKGTVTGVCGGSYGSYPSCCEECN